jgi:biopolymer transport protein ExbD
MKLHLDRTGDDEVRIEIVPLIDVIFCILTFFILAAVTFTRQQAIEVDLPASSTARPQMRQLAIVVINPSRQLLVEGQPVTEAELVAYIQRFVQEQPEGRVALYGSNLAFYSDVLGVLDLLREVAGDRVVLATRPPDDQPLGELEDFNPFGGGLDRPSAPGTTPLPGQPTTPLVPGTPQPGMPSNGGDLGPFPGGAPGERDRGLDRGLDGGAPIPPAPIP